MIVDRYARQVVIPIVVICSCIFLLMFVQRLSSLSVWDDAYMFVRYADNLLQYGNLSWNPNDVNTYGLTSPAYLIVVVPLRLLFQSEPALVMILSSVFSGILAFATMIWFLRKLVIERIYRLVFLTAIAITAVVAGDSLTMHLTSGMDTMFTLWMLSCWLGLLFTSNNLGVIGVFGSLFFVIRPDVLVFPVALIPVLLFSGISHSQSRNYIVGLIAILILQLAIAWTYFGYPLPLSFIAKNLPVYSAEFYGYYSNTAQGYFVEFLLSYIYIIAIIVFGLSITFRLWRWQEKGLLISGVLFCIYHIIFVVPIMGFAQRFFYPMLPVLIFLTARMIPHMINHISQRFLHSLKTYPHRGLFVAVLLIPALINPMPILITLIQYSQPDRIPTIGIGHFDLQTTYDYLYSDNWYRLDELSRLDDDIVIATTEVGLPGVMNPDKEIIDMAGLNQTNFAFDGFDVDWLMAKENQPDWIYLPFPHYEGMWFAITENPVFQLDYDFFYAQALGTSMDVAIKRDSRLYSDMLEILNNL